MILKDKQQTFLNWKIHMTCCAGGMFPKNCVLKSSIRIPWFFLGGDGKSKKKGSWKKLGNLEENAGE